LYAHDLPPDPLTPHDRPDPAHPPQGPDREPPHIDDPEPLDHPVPIGEPPTPPRPMA
jgi:hypothetical protein